VEHRKSEIIKTIPEHPTFIPFIPLNVKILVPLFLYFREKSPMVQCLSSCIMHFEQYRVYTTATKYRNYYSHPNFICNRQGPTDILALCCDFKDERTFNSRILKMQGMARKKKRRKKQDSQKYNASKTTKMNGT
jgi:hypothetical protein